MICESCGSRNTAPRHYHYGIKTDQSTRYINVNATQYTTSYMILGAFDVAVCFRCAAQAALSVFKPGTFDFRDVRGVVILGVIFLIVIIGLSRFIGFMFDLTGMMIALFGIGAVIVSVAALAVKGFIDSRNDLLNWYKDNRLSSISKTLDIPEPLVAFTNDEYSRLEAANR